MTNEKISGGSLSGKNKERRLAGAGSSPASLTKSKKTLLWKQLRRYDRAISEYKKGLWFLKKDYNIPLDNLEVKQQNNYLKIDQKRKEVRLKLKDGKAI